MSAPKSMTNHARIRRAAFFMLLALLAEVASLAWRHPLSIYAFGAAGGLLGFLSVTSLLLSLVSRPAELEPPEQAEADDEEEREVAAG